MKTRKHLTRVKHVSIILGTFLNAHKGISMRFFQMLSIFLTNKINSVTTLGIIDVVNLNGYDLWLEKLEMNLFQNN